MKKSTNLSARAQLAIARFNLGGLQVSPAGSYIRHELADGKFGGVDKSQTASK